MKKYLMIAIAPMIFNANAIGAERIARTHATIRAADAATHAANAANAADVAARAARASRSADAYIARITHVNPKLFFGECYEK